MWETIIVNPFTNILLLIYQFVGQNFGIAIILFTIVSRLLLHPLMAKQIKSSQAMQSITQSKEWQDIQKKYKDDKERLQQEQIKMYQKLGINPLGSCLPMLIQMPIMFGLYQAVVRALAASPLQLLTLTHSIWPVAGLANLIPINSQFLWMNLGQPERANIFGYAVPLLAVITAVTTYIQSKVTIPPVTNPNDQTASMNQSMTLMMPLMMGWFAYTLASGLAIYIIVGNLLSLVQYALLGKVYWSNLLPKKTAATARKK